MRFTDVREAPPKLITRAAKAKPLLAPSVLRRALPKPVKKAPVKAVKTIMVPRNKAVQISRREIIRVPAGTRISTPRGGSYFADRPMRVVVPASTKVILPMPFEVVSSREQPATSPVVQPISPLTNKATAARVLAPKTGVATNKASSATQSKGFDWKWLLIGGLAVAAVAGWGRKAHAST